MSIEDTLEMMSEITDKAVQMPFSGKKCLVDVEKLRDLIDEIHLNMPTEIKQAKGLVNDRKTIINDARAEAEAIVRKAEERAKQLVSEQEITRQAQSRASEIMITAQQKSREIRISTKSYVDNMLGRIEELLGSDIQEIRKARAALKDK